MKKIKFSLKEDFNRFREEARDHDIQLRAFSERRLTMSVSGLTDEQAEIVEKRYNGKVSDDYQYQPDAP